MQISDTLKKVLNGESAPTSGQFRTGMGQLFDFIATFLGMDTDDKAAARAGLGAAGKDEMSARIGTVGGLTFRNKLINSKFAINQLVLSGTVVLTAGQYGHDGWKAGASGCTYTFATTGNNTVVTISAGSLVQVIEGRFINGGVYTVSQRGSANFRVAINGAPLAGSFVPGPITTAAANSGASIQVEFSTGTIDRPQVEEGDVASVYTAVPEFELARCQRYFYKTYLQSVAPGTPDPTGVGAYIHFPEAANSYVSFKVRFPVAMAATPTVTLYSSINGATGVIANTDTSSNLPASVIGISESGCTPYVNNSPVSQTNGIRCHLTASARL